MDMVFEIYGQSMESRYKEMTLPIVKLQFNIKDKIGTTGELFLQKNSL